MRILITGATGFIGRHVVATLAGRGDDVAAASHDPLAARGRLPAGIPACGLGPADLAGALGGCDAVVNLAGVHLPRRWTDADRARIVASRVETTHALVAALEAMPRGSRPLALVNASACWYGDTGERVVDETERRGDDFFSRLCVAWEQAAERATSLGVRVVVGRFGVALGRGGPLEEMAAPFRAFVGAVPGTGRQWVSWVRVEDLVAFVVAALDDVTFAGAYNVVSPQPIRMAELCDGVARAVGRPSWGRVPEPLLAAALGEMGPYLAGSVRAAPRRLLERGFPFRHPRLGRSLEELLGAGR